MDLTHNSSHRAPESSPPAQDEAPGGMNGNSNLPFPAEGLRFPEHGPTPVPPLPATTVSNRSRWAQRVWLVIFVVFCIELGMLLAVLPWTRVWTENSLMFAHPGLRAIMQQNFVRGLATGLGLVDIWIGIWEAVRYREYRKAN
jgi:hypothetical protein